MALGLEPIPLTDDVVDQVLRAAGSAMRATDVVYRTDGLEIAWISPSVHQILGYRPEDLVGQPARTLLSPDQDTTWVDDNRMRLLAGHEVVQRMVMRDAAGNDLRMVGIARPLPGGGPGFVATVRVEDEVAAPVLASAEPGVIPIEGIESRHEILGYLNGLMDDVGHRELCVLVVEFSNLRMVNDSLGFETGDAALTELAQRIRSTMPDDDRIGRISGKEFLIGCRRPPTPEEALARAGQLIESWSSPIVVDGKRIEPMLTAAVVPANAGSTALSLLREADIALSHSNADGHSSVVVFEEEMGARAVRRFVLEDELRFALDAGEFELYFQPIVSLPSGDLVAAEALVRWRHPREGILTPVTFMPVAEESRLIRPIGRLVLSRALDALASLPAHSMQIGINVSAVELSDPTWLDSVTFTIDRSGVDPCCLVLEITETAILNSQRDLAGDLKRLREMGVAVFLDDFGTGYSSLAMLRDLPVSGIKLDKTFVASLEDEDSFGAALAQGIVDLIRPLGLAGVAEGIETPQQAERLAELGWQFGQGYSFGRPGPLRALPTNPSRPHGARPRLVEGDH